MGKIVNRVINTNPHISKVIKEKRKREVEKIKNDNKVDIKKKSTKKTKKTSVSSENKVSLEKQDVFEPTVPSGEAVE